MYSGQRSSVAEHVEVGWFVSQVKLVWYSYNREDERWGYNDGSREWDCVTD